MYRLKWDNTIAFCTISSSTSGQPGVGGDEDRKEMEPGLLDLEGHWRCVGFHTETGAIGPGVSVCVGNRGMT